MDNLIQLSDPDLVAFNEGARPTRREQYFLRAASQIIRDYCNWHIAPSITDTYDKLPIGSGGIIMLPSLYVTDVASVTINSPAGDSILDPGDYDWFRQGYIEAKSQVWPYNAAYGPYKFGLATVVMTHGYPVCPLPVKSVIFELMRSGDLAVANGNVKEVASPNYRIQWSGGGLSASVEQLTRLSGYRIGGIK